MSTQDPDKTMLAEFSAAWNSHDVDAVMKFFADDAVYVAARGTLPDGERMEGVEAIRAGIATRLGAVADLAFVDNEYLRCGPDTFFSSWRMTGGGGEIDVRGCDFYRLRDGKVVLKDSFLKAKP